MWGKALKRHQGSQVTLPWDLHGVRPSRGNLVVVMGSPGVGKSLFGLNWCLGIDQPSILVSLDTDMATQAMRACSILAGVPEEQVEKRPEAWAQFLDQKNLLCRMYDLTVTPRDVQDIIEAETEYWGVTPSPLR